MNWSETLACKVQDRRPRLGSEAESWRGEVLQITSGKTRFPLELFLGQAKGVDPVIGELGEKDNARHTSQNCCCSRRESPQLEELHGGGHPQGLANLILL